MKRFLPWIILLLSLAWIGSNWRLPKAGPGQFDLDAFGKLPVLVGGRAKPIDTVARNSLMIIRGRQTVRLEGGKSLSAREWLADMMFKVPVANKYPTLIINNPDVLGMFGWQQTDRKFFSQNELLPFFPKIDEQGQAAEGVEAPQRSAFQTAVFNLRNSLILYQRLNNTIQPDDADDFTAETDAYLTAISARAQGTGAALKSGTNNPPLEAFLKRYQNLAEMNYMLPIAPEQPNADWESMGANLLKASQSGKISPIAKAYAMIGDDYRTGNAELFNQHVKDLSDWMAKNQPRATSRCNFEFLFNHLAPFYQSMSLYVLVFLLVAGSWLGWTRELNRSALYVLLLALAIHTFGLLARMYIQERPPVTNLYSSAIFIGWGTVIIALFLERYFRDGVGMACSAVIGFVTLIIAHHLAGSGDTLEMLQAVLDTNIWLATHVVVVTIGYSAMFLAGMLAIIYVVKGFFTRSLTKESAKSLTGMIYGVICFAALFSFVGTVLGGIWADQSWGRFWGWDPKENGALLIVLWCAVILHARWGGYIKQRGLIMLTIFGNVITSFSWFGVNMLGVGLHSYGFMNKAFPWLVGFMLSQIALIALASLPLTRWKSFRNANA